MVPLAGHALYDVWHHRQIRQLPFPSVRVKTISRRFQKNSTLGTVFENLRFWCPKTPLTCGHEAKTEKKISVFKNIRIRVDVACVQTSPISFVVPRATKEIGDVCTQASVDEAGVLGSSNSIIHFPRLQLANLSVSRKVWFQSCFHDYVWFGLLKLFACDH